MSDDKNKISSAEKRIPTMIDNRPDGGPLVGVGLGSGCFIGEKDELIGVTRSKLKKDYSCACSDRSVGKREFTSRGVGAVSEDGWGVQAKTEINAGVKGMGIHVGAGGGYAEANSGEGTQLHFICKEIAVDEYIDFDSLTIEELLSQFQPSVRGELVYVRALWERAIVFQFLNSLKNFFNANT